MFDVGGIFGESLPARSTAPDARAVACVSETCPPRQHGPEWP